MHADPRRALTKPISKLILGSLVRRGFSCSAFVLAEGGCRQVVGIEDRFAGELDATPAQCGPVPVPAGPCGSCVADHCCGENAACANDLRCRDLATCESPCDPADRVCLGDCLSLSSDFGAVDALSSCEFAHCAEPCVKTCGGFTFRLPTCAPCVQQKCCEEAIACATDDVCVSVAQCLASSTPGAWGAMNKCYSAEFESALKDVTLRSCLRRECGDACGIGHSWSCVGAVEKPLIDEQTVLFAIQFTDFDANPLQGVDVHACRRRSSPCDAQYQGMTDEQGSVILQVAVGAEGFDGYVTASHPDVIGARFTWQPLITGNPPELAWAIPSWLVLDSFGQQVGLQQDHSLGLVVITVLDCANGPAPEVEVKISDSAARVTYTRDDQLSISSDRTDDSGIALIVNVQPGLPDVAVSLADTEQEVARAAVQVEAGTISYVLLSPTR